MAVEILGRGRQQREVQKRHAEAHEKTLGQQELPYGAAEGSQREPEGHQEHPGNGDRPRPHQAQDPAAPQPRRRRRRRRRRGPGPVLDAGYHGVDEQAAGPGEPVAQRAHEGEQRRRRRGLRRRRGRDDVLAGREVVLLEDAEALVVPDRQRYGHERGQEHRGLLPAGYRWQGRRRS